MNTRENEEHQRLARVAAFEARRKADPVRFRLEVELAWAKKELLTLATYDPGTGENAMRAAAEALRTVEQAGADGWHPPREDEHEEDLKKSRRRSWNRTYKALLAEVEELRALTGRLLGHLDRLRRLSDLAIVLADDAAALQKAVGSAKEPR